MDEFDGKRKMVQTLLGALKKSAGDELSHGIGGDSTKKQITHTPIPKESVAEHPHNKESFKAGSKDRQEPKPTLGDVEVTPEGSGEGMGGEMQMSEGGMAEHSDQPEREMPSDTHEAEGGEDPKEEMAEGPIEEEDEDNNSSAFKGFMKKKKK